MHTRVLIFHVWIPYEKIADPYFFVSALCLFWELCPLKNKMELLLGRYLKTVRVRTLIFGILIGAEE